jgi:hypothetical protein
MSLNMVTPEPRSMISLPTEIKLEVLHFIRDSIPVYSFHSDPILAMQHAAIYKNILLAVALLNPDWTEVAQSKLFQSIHLSNQTKTASLFNVLRESETLRGYARNVATLRFGEIDYEYEGRCVKEALDEITSYCPDVVAIECCGVHARLEDFRTNLFRLPI